MSLVLIVEDNERNLKLVRDVLGFAGFLRPWRRATAEAGIELARAQKPDVV
jgi:two-component system cell cycle response regulator DivK